MATKPADEPKPDYTNDETGEEKPPAPLAWEAPGTRRPMLRGKNLRPRRPR